jgi:hypothetical protein
MMVGYGDMIRSHEEACRLFNQEHADRPPIARSTVSRIVSKFFETGSVKDLPRQGRPQINEDTKLQILLEAEENPHISTRQLALNNNIDHSYVVKLFKKEKYTPYKVCLIHELNEDDPDRRLQFCEELMLRCHEDLNFLNNILFSDEATFTLNGSVNRHNCRYWSRENPHWTQQHYTQRRGKINVWAGMIGNRLLGPYFFEENLNGNQYLDFLQFELVPALTVLFPNHEDGDLPNQRIWYQQDGAPPHFAVQVRNFLNNVFPNRWIGRRGPFEWPPRSPDLTPLDFFLWGHLKSKVYVDKPNSLEDLKRRIRVEMANITPDIINNTIQSVYTRAGQCQIANGWQFEHLR